jgi:hypothetical protein
MKSPRAGTLAPRLIPSRLGRPLCGPSAEHARWVQGELSNFGPSISAPDKDDAVPRVRKANGGKCEGGSRYNVPDVMRGPRYFDRPRAGTLAPRLLRFPVGPAVLQASAEPLRWVQGELSNPPKRAATADSKVALYRHALPTFTSARVGRGGR